MDQLEVQRSYHQRKFTAMINRIICPTDFSPEANNATLYSAKLAQETNSSLMLLHVERAKPMAAGARLAGITNDEENKRFESKLEQLKSTAAEVRRTFNITCECEMDISTEALAKTIAIFGTGNSMIVMGTNGADNLFQFFFGSNTYHVIREANCPVLMVPDKSEYSSLNKIVYALTYEEKGRLAIDGLIEFARSFPKAIFHFVHVSAKDTAISQDVYNAMKEEVETICGGKIVPHFSRVFTSDTTEGIQSYLESNPPDLLVMAAHHRNIFESLFSAKPVLEGLSAVPTLPMLVFHA